MPAVAAWISLAATALSGCLSTKEDLLPQDGPTMQEVYTAHFQAPPRWEAPDPGLDRRGAEDGPELTPSRRVTGETLGAVPASRSGDGDGLRLTGYTREAATEIDAHFPRLPNPDLVMYVFPHLSADAYPVPGYATVVPMYERVEYALPGEKEGW
jgi:conjugative transfer region lipoprotein (TIGR03751 family)